MAHAANLSSSYSAERSIQDEISRESFADASTVAWSYAAMLAYVSVALASIPASAVVRMGWGRAILLHSKVGLGVGGVAIVLAAVLGALGLTSLCGIWCSLISLEVGFGEIIPPLPPSLPQDPSSHLQTCPPSK